MCTSIIKISFLICILFLQTGAPILMSFPHFYLGSETLREPFEGLEEPEQEKHESYVDIHQVNIS